MLNIKAVLQKNTDPGLIAMTGIINLLNQVCVHGSVCARMGARQRGPRPPTCTAQ